MSSTKPRPVDGLSKEALDVLNRASKSVVNLDLDRVSVAAALVKPSGALKDLMDKSYIGQTFARLEAVKPLGKHFSALRSELEPISKWLASSAIKIPQLPASYVTVAQAGAMTEQWAQIHSISKQFRDSLAHSVVPDVFERLRSEHRAQYEQFAEALNRFKVELDLPDSVAHLLETMDTASLAVDAAAAQLASDGGVREGEQRQAAAAFEQLVQGAGNEATIVGLLTKILSAIQAQQDSRLQKWLWLFVYPLLLALVMSAINPYSDFQVKRFLERTHFPQESPQESTKVVKQEARRAVDDICQLSGFRFVNIGSGKTLAVRSAAGARASVVGQLRFGQAVYVVEKSKDFTLVEWRSEDGSAVLRGWVFSRYLQRFN